MRIAALILLLAGCAGGVASLIEPEFNVRVVRVPGARPQRANAFSSIVEVDVVNRSSEALTLESLQITSVGVGSYTIPAVTQRFNKIIPPNQFELFKVWVQVVAEETIGQAEEPIFVRGMAEFRTESGSFRRTFTQRVNPSTISRPPRG